MKVKLYKIICFYFIFFLFPCLSFAGTKIELIDDILYHSRVKQTLDDIKKSNSEKSIKFLKDSYDIEMQYINELPDEIREAFKKEISELHNNILSLNDKYDRYTIFEEVYIEYYSKLSLKELNEIVEFYKSEAGSKYAKIGVDAAIGITSKEAKINMETILKYKSEFADKIYSIRNKIPESLDIYINDLEENLKKIPSGDKKYKQTLEEINKLKMTLSEITTAISYTPEKILRMERLSDEVDYLKETDKNIRDEFTRNTSTVNWLIGIIISIGLAFFGMVLTLVYQSKSKT